MGLNSGIADDPQCAHVICRYGPDRLDIFNVLHASRDVLNYFSES